MTILQARRATKPLVHIRDKTHERTLKHSSLIEQKNRKIFWHQSERLRGRKLNKQELEEFDNKDYEKG